MYGMTSQGLSCLIKGLSGCFLGECCLRVTFLTLAITSLSKKSCFVVPISLKSLSSEQAMYIALYLQQESLLW